jgi:hypothetical protein
MDKFMIDPKEEREIINKIQKLESPNLILNNENLPVGQVERIEEIPIGPQMFSFTHWIIWILILLCFVVFMIYYSFKYTTNESNYIIKGNATSFKLSLDEIKEDIKDFLRRWIEWVQSWNENISDKSRQFFFRQHVEDNTFKSKRTIKKNQEKTENKKTEKDKKVEEDEEE